MGQKPLVSLRPSEQQKQNKINVLNVASQKTVENGDWGSVFGFSDVECLPLKYYQPNVLIRQGYMYCLLGKGMHPLGKLKIRHVFHIIYRNLD